MADKEVAIISANLGNFDKEQTVVRQTVGFDHIVYTDENFPPRSQSMSPRLQARIPKMFSWEMAPGYDYYIWVDSSCNVTNEGAIQWFIDQLGSADAAFFKHPNRNTVQEEADYLKKRLAKNCPYITPRYKGERIDDQLAVVDENAELLASTAFIYRDTIRARDLLTIWWLHTSLYHSIDQLSLPHAIKSSGAEVDIIHEDYTKIPWITYVRNK